MRQDEAVILISKAIGELFIAFPSKRVEAEELRIWIKRTAEVCPDPHAVDMALKLYTGQGGRDFLTMASWLQTVTGARDARNHTLRERRQQEAIAANTEDPPCTPEQFEAFKAKMREIMANVKEPEPNTEWIREQREKSRRAIPPEVQMEHRIIRAGISEWETENGRQAGDPVPGMWGPLEGSGMAHALDFNDCSTACGETFGEGQEKEDVISTCKPWRKWLKRKLCRRCREEVANAT